jgi:GT2 family glycosyltransferase
VRRIGARVESRPFEDFASARNEALETFGEGADWLVMFDPDERLDAHTIANIPELLFKDSADIYLAPLQALYPDGSRRDFVAKPFLFKNRPEIRWIFKVHEKLVGSRNQVLLKNALITHIVELHEDGRRQRASAFYDGLMKREPYFTSEQYKWSMRAKWPILDYDRLDDDRISKKHVGPLISVVVPTYKRIELLSGALLSIWAQDYPNVEAVVVGDACPDVPAWLEEVRTKAPRQTQLRVFNLRKNHGAGGAVPRNHAIQAAAGSLIAYLDDDNKWKPDHLSSLYEAMRSSGATFAFSSMEVDGKDMGFTEPKHQGIDTSCVLHRKDLVEKYGFWKDRIEGGYAHDWEFISRWVKGGEKWACTQKPTLIYNAATSGQADFLKAAVK